MTHATTLAISKAIAKKTADEARENLAPGTYQIDQTVRVTGTLTVAEDTEKTPTVSIPFKDVLVLFVQRAGITREASLELLRTCVTEALKKSDGGAAGCLDEHLEGVFSAAVADMLATLPKTPVKGAVKSKLVVSEVILTGKPTA